MNDKNPPDPKERVVVLLGLAASKPIKSEKCPSDEELAAFIDNRLRGRRRKSMLIHINRCSSCYHQWFEIASYYSTANGLKIEKHQRINWSKISHALAALFGQWKVAMPAAVAVAVVVFLLFSPTPSNLDAQISENYKVSIGANGAQLSSNVSDLPLPWEKAALGFSETKDTAPSRAFGAGIWAGKNKLLQTDGMTFPENLSPPSGLTWQESEWRDYYALGRWAVLLWATARSQQTSTDWDAHLQILTNLRTNLSERPVAEASAQEAEAALDRIEPLLAKAKSRSDSEAYTTLSRTLLMIMERLAPSTL